MQLQPGTVIAGLTTVVVGLITILETRQHTEDQVQNRNVRKIEATQKEYAERLATIETESVATRETLAYLRDSFISHVADHTNRRSSMDALGIDPRRW